MPQNLVETHHPSNDDPSLGGKTIEGEAMKRESPSTQISNQLTRRDFAIRTAALVWPVLIWLLDSLLQLR